VELLIVLTILLILVVVAIPNYQQARNAALIKSIVADLIGYAKACAVINSSGLGETPTPPAIAVDRGGVVILQGCSAVNEGATLQASWGGARASGVTCLSDSSESTSRQANLTISAGNLLSCSFVD
jgi:Tfp pilus assembly protein FimT